MFDIITPSEVRTWLTAHRLTPELLGDALNIEPYKLERLLDRPKLTDHMAARIATLFLRAQRREVWTLRPSDALASADTGVETREEIPVVIAGKSYDAAKVLPLTIGQIRQVYTQHGVDLTEKDGVVGLDKLRAMALLVLTKLSAAATVADVEAIPMRRLHQIVQGMFDSASAES